jgi:hypothetical protein
LVGIGATGNMESDVGDNGNGNGSDTIKHKLLWQTTPISTLEYADNEVEDDGIDNELIRIFFSTKGIHFICVIAE